MTKAVLVTGGAGYIGSHTCKALSRLGYLPVTYDNLSRGHKSSVKWGPLEIGDLEDNERLGAVIDAHKPVAAIHFAAFAYVGESVSKPLLYYQNNVGQTVAMLDTMNRHDLKRVVFSSSCAIYGIPSQLPITEDTPAAPINPYGASKLMVEQILRDCSSAYGLDSVSLRYFNAAGADRDGEIGEEHEPETHLIPLAMQAALGSAPPLKVFGSDYDTPDGSAIRDYIHVDDLATAHVAALGYLLNDGKTTSINVGTGVGASVLDIIKAVETASGRKVPWSAAPRRTGDPAKLVADPSRLKSTLTVDPAAFMPLQEIILSAWQWHVSHHNQTENHAMSAHGA